MQRTKLEELFINAFHIMKKGFLRFYFKIEYTTIFLRKQDFLYI